MASIFYTDVLPSGLNIYNEKEFRIVMVGKTGAGKSATGNTILGREDFVSRVSPKSLTLHCDKKYGEVEGQNVILIDTPGLFDTRTDEAEILREVAQSVSYASPGPHVFLIVIKLDRFTEEEKQTVQKIQEVFGADADRYSMVLFTHGDLLKDRSIEDFLKDSEELQELVTRCNNQYHVFNNNLKKDRSQVIELLDKIRKIREKNGRHHYTNLMFQVAERVIQLETQRILKETEEKRLKDKEALRKEIEKEYEEQLREANCEVEKMKKSLTSHERELRETQEMLEEMRRHRQEAEQSSSVIRVISEALHSLRRFFNRLFHRAESFSENAFILAMKERGQNHPFCLSDYSQ